MSLDKTIRYIPIAHLQLDRENPRLPERLRGIDKKISEDQIISWMLEDASLLDLVMSISTNGYFPGEPVLVVENAELKGHYIVVEGNRRVAACKIIQTPDKDRVRKIAIQDIIRQGNQELFPNEIPILVFDRRREIIDYLGYRHVTGIQSWSPLAKARYLNELFNVYSEEHPEHNHDFIYRLITRRIASRIDYVKRLLVSFQLYQIIQDAGFYRIKGLDESTLEFSKLSDAATKYVKLRDFLGINLEEENPLNRLNIEHFHDLVHWLFERNNQNITRIGESRNIALLADVVGNPDSLKAFKEGADLPSALLRSEYPREQFRKFVQEGLENLKSAYEITYRVDVFEPSVRENLEEINAIIRKVATIIRESSNQNSNQPPLFG